MLFRKADNRKNLKQIDSYGKMEQFIKERNEKNIIERKRCSRRDIVSMLAPMSMIDRWFSGKVSFCTSVKKWKKASLTIETAMVLPLFFLGTVTILSFMDVYKLETEKLMKLCEHVKEAGMYAYVLDDSGPEEITLPDLYAYEPVGGLLPVSRVWLHNVVKVHAWTGKGEAWDVSGESDETEEMVLVTENGQVYHLDPKCTYLDLSIRQENGTYVKYKRNAYGERYDACETCSRNQAPAGTVYVTNTGSSYHNLESCSSLKRTVRMVTESQVEGMHACSRCG